VIKHSSRRDLGPPGEQAEGKMITVCDWSGLSMG
jgi:hypothetical protein